MKLRIEKAIYGGAGLSHIPSDTATADAGKAVFIPHTLPGELVECELTDNRRSFANARLTNILEPSPARVAPPCEYFPTCGGCHYQHAAYDEQLVIKRAILSETLTHAGVALPAGSIATLASPPLGYRNRVRLHIRYGDSALCYKEAGSHRDVPVDHCPIAAPLLQQAIREFPAILNATGLPSGLYDEVEFFTNAAEVEFFTNTEESALLLSLWTTQGSPATQALPILCESLSETLPTLRGALLFSIETQKSQGRQQASWGDPKLTYTIGDQEYRVSAGSFFQVNRFLLPAMLEQVTNVPGGQQAWDLYAGAGLFARGLARRFERVTAVESSASSVRDLRDNLKGGRHRIVASSTLDFLKAETRSTKNEPPDLVVVDPPRAGLGKDVTTLLSRIGPPRLTYISCDPATLARDLQWLLHSGYHLEKVTLVDLFPQSFHLETIAELVST